MNDQRTTSRTFSEDHRDIRAVVEDWVVFREAGDWDAFATVWHSGGWMSANWFQGPWESFVEASRLAFDNGVQILHFLEGFTCRVAGDRAIDQTEMKVEQRAQGFVKVIVPWVIEAAGRQAS
jgi:hypothetical protein